MNKFYLIFIVAYLTEQLEANVYDVRPIDVSRGNPGLVSLDFGAYHTQIFTFHHDANQEDIRVKVVSYDPGFENVVEVELEDPCNTDPSTEEGTLAAMLWTSISIDSCPIKAGSYEMITKFNQTGIIKNMFRPVDEFITITFEPISTRFVGGSLFTLFDEVRILEGNP